MKLIFKIAILLAFISSCSNIKEKKEYDIVKEYLSDKLGVDSAKQIKHVFILAEKGCINCNKSFMNLALWAGNKPESIIIVKAKGNVIEISLLEEMNNTNVIMDNKGNQKDVNTLFKTSRFIELGQNKIDTIITIESKSIKEDFKYIQWLLEKH